MIDCKKSKNHGWYDEATGCKWCPVPVEIKVDPVKVNGAEVRSSEWSDWGKFHREEVQRFSGFDTSGSVSDDAIKQFAAQAQDEDEVCNCGDSYCDRGDPLIDDDEICECGDPDCDDDYIY